MCEIIKNSILYLCHHGVVINISFINNIVISANDLCIDSATKDILKACILHVRRQ